MNSDPSAAAAARLRGEPRPKARTQGLLVDDLDGETLVYDLREHAAHCLNRSAAEVWRCADGSRTIAEIARRLASLGLPADEEVVWLAVERLEKAGLLEESLESRRGMSRKEAIRALGLTAGLTLLLPAVTSITAPLAAQAASCITAAQCYGSRPPNCTGLPICGNRSQCCVTQGSKKCRPWRC